MFRSATEFGVSYNLLGAFTGKEESWDKSKTRAVTNMNVVGILFF